LIGAQFLHSLDGGNTWTQATTKPLEGFSPLGLSVLPDGTAFAALDNTITQTSAIAVYVLTVRSGWELFAFPLLKRVRHTQTHRQAP
jgi:hypothetical protein